jgi:uncharacterized cupredoxin-like copper-binding protein
LRRAAAWAGACTLLIGALRVGNDRNDADRTGTPHGTALPDRTVVNATVREWRLTADISMVPAGPVKFTTANLGTINHEFVVVRTDIPDGQIPLDGDLFSEDTPGVWSPGKISELTPNTVGEAVIDLEPGRYQLVCNIPHHYHRGMHIPFQAV